MILQNIWWWFLKVDSELISSTLRMTFTYRKQFQFVWSSTWSDRRRFIFSTQLVSNRKLRLLSSPTGLIFSRRNQNDKEKTVRDDGQYSLDLWTTKERAPGHYSFKDQRTFNEKKTEGDDVGFVDDGVLFSSMNERTNETYHLTKETSLTGAHDEA